MEDLRCHSVHTFFKILDAEMYGGVGSIGYACSNANHCTNFPKTLEEETAYTDSIKKDFAKIAGCKSENVIWISREEYFEATKEDEEDQEEEEDEN